MNFAKILMVVVACLAAMAVVCAAPEPKWKLFKKIEKVGRNIRDGAIKAGPAIAVLGQAKALG